MCACTRVLASIFCTKHRYVCVCMLGGGACILSCASLFAHTPTQLCDFSCMARGFMALGERGRGALRGESWCGYFLLCRCRRHQCRFRPAPTPQCRLPPLPVSYPRGSCLPAAVGVRGGNSYHECSQLVVAVDVLLSGGLFAGHVDVAQHVHVGACL